MDLHSIAAVIDRHDVSAALSHMRVLRVQLSDAELRWGVACALYDEVVTSGSPGQIRDGARALVEIAVTATSDVPKDHELSSWYKNVCCDLADYFRVTEASPDANRNLFILGIARIAGLKGYALSIGDKNWSGIAQSQLKATPQPDRQLLEQYISRVTEAFSLEPHRAIHLMPGEYLQTNVLFATNRAPTIKGKISRDPFGVFGGKFSVDASYGLIDVTVPVFREAGSINLAKKGKERKRERDKRAEYFVVGNLQFLAIEMVDNAISDELSDARQKEALLFVHGYNTAFHRAALRAAQLAVDLQIDGVIALYSWPSKASLFGYGDDRRTAANEACALTLADLIKRLKEHAGVIRLTIVAHSMGNEVLIRALAHLNHDIGTNENIADCVVFASPDVSETDFKKFWSTSAASKIARSTLYVSEIDVALRVSENLPFQMVRAGSNPDIALPGIIDVVDTASAGNWMRRFGEINHDDYCTLGLLDMRGICWLGLPAVARHATVKPAPVGSSWQLRNEASDNPTDAYFEGLQLIRDEGWDGATETLRARREAARHVPDQFQHFSRALQQVTEMHAKLQVRTQAQRPL